MNRETIIKMAREAGLAEVTDTAESLPADYVEALAKLCAMAVAKEREECAKVCESRYMGDNNREDMEARQCAAAIRARGEAGEQPEPDDHQHAGDFPERDDDEQPERLPDELPAHHPLMDARQSARQLLAALKKA